VKRRAEGASDRLRAPERRSSVTAQEEEDEPSSSSPLIQQIVKLETIHSMPRFYRPWETESSIASVSSGFIVDLDRRWVLTTAGAVDYASRVSDPGRHARLEDLASPPRTTACLLPLQVSVSRVGDPQAYKARVLASCADCDAALLTVDSDGF
jgi:hypothetical protein